ncbi:hypothetical protein LJR231_003270 [Phyllobacterium sp. LjRoot231]|uniref:hypothetical protein n=1 Tax=Phyllobacterium sp. LjRoot231 TaxID=3342289 RepID=UPI003ECD3A9D
MTIRNCTIGEITHIVDDDLFVGEVIFQFSGDGHVSPTGQTSSHEMLIVIRIKGDKTWPFDRVQSEFLKEAQTLILQAGGHLDGATIESLNDYNIASAKGLHDSMVSSLLSTMP